MQMSATIDAAPFDAYFGHKLPVIEAPGVQHHVQVLWLPQVLDLLGTEELPARGKGSKGKGRQRTKASLKEKCEETSNGGKGGKGAKHVQGMCTNFNTKRGCKYGKKCKFMHAKPDTKGCAVNTSNTSEGCTQQSPNKSTRLDPIDYGLLTRIVGHILDESDGDGAVLVFVPGISEIKRVRLRKYSRA